MGENARRLRCGIELKTVSPDTKHLGRCLAGATVLETASLWLKAISVRPEVLDTPGGAGYKKRERGNAYIKA